MKAPRPLALFTALALSGLTLVSHAAGLTVGYQTGIDPSKVPQADGAYERAISEKIDWRRFNSGPEVVTAIASGDVQIGNLGSSPVSYTHLRAHET